MSETKYTPGPWFEHREGFSAVYVEARIGGGMIQEVAVCGPTEAGQEQQAANANMIAAAPELLEALELLVDNPYRDGTESDERLRRIGRAAIAKAKGESTC